MSGRQARPDDSNSVIVSVRVKLRATRAGILGRHGDGIKAAVHAAAERGRANEELIAVLAQAFGVQRGQVEIVAGTTSQDKMVRVTGISSADLRQRLHQLLDEMEA